MSTPIEPAGAQPEPHHLPLPAMPRLRVALPAAALAALAGLAAGTFFLTSLDPSSRWLQQMFAVKQTALRETAGADGRILVLGDSNALFGVDTPHLARLTGRPAINLGYVASMGPIGMFGFTLDRLRPGDILVLSMLPSAFDRSPVTTSDAWITAWRNGEPGRALGGDPPLVAGGPTAYLRGFFDLTTPGLRRIVNYFARGALRIKMFRYEDLDFDTTGYLTGRVTLPHPPMEGHPEYAPVWTPILREVQRQAATRGATVVYSLPWVQASPDDVARYRKRAEAFTNSLTGIIPVLPDPSGTIHSDPGLFSDFQAHLSVEGARRRTDALAAGLRESGLLEPAP